MLNTKFILAGAAALAFLVPAAIATSAQAGHKEFRRSGNVYTPGINRRIQRQNRRIRAGSRNGDLTRGEKRRLRSGLRNIRHELRYARNDGIVTRRERRKLHRMLNRNSRRINRLRHNARYSFNNRYSNNDHSHRVSRRGNRNRF